MSALSRQDTDVDGLLLSEWRGCDWWPNGHVARINAGFVGHDREIVLVVEPYDMYNPYERGSQQVPREVVLALLALLPQGWKVESRGTRVEIHPSGRFAGGFAPEDVELVAQAACDMGLSLEKVEIAP